MPTRTGSAPTHRGQAWSAGWYPAWGTIAPQRVEERLRLPFGKQLLGEVPRACRGQLRELRDAIEDAGSAPRV